MLNERELLVDCLGRLNRLVIDYMLVGSMASNYWGIPRTTHDLDFVLALQRADVDRVADAFQSGFFVQRESIRGAFAPPHQFNAIDESSALKVDFWLLRDDAFERQAFERRRQADLFGVSAWVMTPEDLILHMLYRNRLTPSDRQVLDAAGVWSVQADQLDGDYLRQWATALAVAEQLDDVCQGRIKPKST